MYSRSAGEDRKSVALVLLVVIRPRHSSSMNVDRYEYSVMRVTSMFGSTVGLQQRIKSWAEAGWEPVNISTHAVLLFIVENSHLLMRRRIG